MRAMSLLHVLIFISAFISLSIPGAAQPDNNSFKKTSSELDSFFSQLIIDRDFVGLGACLIKDKKIIWQNSYGYSELETKTPLKQDAIFQLASLSKTVTATAIMHLYEKGLFKLDDDVNNYIPIKVRNPNFPDKPISFRMLLTHTGGFEDLLPMGNKILLGVKGDSDIPLQEFVEELFTPGGKYYSTDYFSKNEPGTKYEYSNISFALIGYLVEKISGKDFSEYCKENLFIPLEMNNTAWHLRDIDTNKVAFGYGFRGNDTAVYKRTEHFGTPGYPEGMLRTTMQDFSNFISMFINNGTFNGKRILKPETVDLMLTDSGIRNIPSRAYKNVRIGLTWLAFDENGEEFFTMNGFSGSIFTNAIFSTKNQTGIIFYFTGIRMKNMSAVNKITKKLQEALK